MCDGVTDTQTDPAKGPQGMGFAGRPMIAMEEEVAPGEAPKG